MDARQIEALEVVPASRKLGRREAAQLAGQASVVVVVKGRNVDEFEPGGTAPAAVVDAMLGPTGNLRAPTIRRGTTVIVGFDEDVFADKLT